VRTSDRLGVVPCCEDERLATAQANSQLVGCRKHLLEANGGVSAVRAEAGG
jgi:hypothetical protein